MGECLAKEIPDPFFERAYDPFNVPLDRRRIQDIYVIFKSGYG